jgi:hypothetical protein
MPLLGQASGGWTESSSALRLLHVGIRNTVGIVTDDSFTQTNPPAITTAATISTRINQRKFGVLSGSVAFTRADAGSNFIGGPGLAATQVAIAANNVWFTGYRALGCFINSATGNPYENLPAQASGKCPYVSAQGTYGNRTYETQAIASTGAITAGDALTYTTGQPLLASRNGYIQPAAMVFGGVLVDFNVVVTSAECFARTAAGVATILGVVKMPPDAVQTEVVYDQRI